LLTKFPTAVTKARLNQHLHWNFPPTWAELPGEVSPTSGMWASMARVNQQPSIHQLAILLTGWAAFFHLAPDRVHHSPFFFVADHCILLYFLVLDCFSSGPDLTHSYPTHFPILVSTAPTLVLYLLYPTDIATLITSYSIDLVTIQITYLTNLATLLITYHTNLPTILTTYPTNLATLHTQSPY
jgi:hypothetical protein